MSKKIIIAKNGKNALTETNLNNLVYHSDYNTLKYYISGSIGLVVSGSDAEITITHNLGYTPFFVAYVNLYGASSANNYNMCPGIFSDAGSYDYSQAYADSVKLYFKVFTNSVSNTFIFKYKIFRNNLNFS